MAGAYAMKLWSERQAAGGDGQQQPRTTLSLEALQRLPGASSIAPSPSPSICSYSLPPTPRVNGGRDSSGGGGADAGLRMCFVVRRDLAWGRQRLAVMTAHACLALFKKLFKGRNPVLMQWELAKGPKLVLRANDEQQLLAVLAAVRAAGVPHHCIAEAAGAGNSGGASLRSSDGGGGGPDVPRRSRTILAFGPLPASEIPKLANGLVLL